MSTMHELFINDVAAGVYGIYLEKAPAIPVAQERGTWQDMPGLDGGYFVSERALQSVDIELNLYVDAGRDVDTVIDYLMGAARIRVTPWLWEWEVSVHDCAPSFSEWLEIPGEGYEVTVTYRANPWRIVWPHVELTATVSSGSTVTLKNDYGATAPYQIKVYDGCTLTVNGDVVMKASGGNVTIDCESRKITNPQYLKLSSAATVPVPKWVTLVSGNNTLKATGSAYATVKARARRR